MFQSILGVAVIVVVVFEIHEVLHERYHNYSAAGVLRVRGLIVEDAAGRERILIGAPVPAVNARKRRDGTVGVIVLGEKGVDRVALGAPVPEPQIQGMLSKRVGNATGFVIDDENGDERGGFGVLDNDGHATFGLDYPHGTGEAISVGVLPGETSLEIHDSKTIVRAAFLERNDSPPILFGLNFRGSSAGDMGILRLNPFAVQHVVIKASDEALNKALDDAGR